MTLRRRWTVSILAILGLFGLNLAVYYWGNTERTGLILELKEALERKDLAVEIRNTVEDRQHDAEVMEPLVASGSVRLSEAELADVAERLEAIGDLIQRLHSLAQTGQTVRLKLRYEELQEAWLEIYRSVPADPETRPLEAALAILMPAEAGADAEEVPEDGTSSGAESEEAVEDAEPVRTSRFHELHRRLAVVLAELEESEASRARTAEQEFSAVAALTDRITLAIFVISTLLAVGIALWFSRFLRETFSRYLTAEVVSRVLESPSGAALGGEKREITVLMADLRGFSTLAERIPAEQVVAVINNYLGAMTEVIVEAGGTIDEFIGDAILVFFGAPKRRQDHAEAAVRCALRMQLAMSKVNDANRSAGLPLVEAGIGVHSGEAVVGNIGSEKRTKYAAVGPTVNLASRIQAKAVGGQILVSRQTVERVHSELRIDSHFEIRPKGLDQGVTVFEIGGMMGEHELQLPSEPDSLVELQSPIAVRFTVLKGKDTGGERLEGRILKLSPRAAVIASAARVEPLTDIRLELVEKEGREGVSVYAKVAAGEAPRSDAFVVRFTSLAGRTLELIDPLIRR